MGYNGVINQIIKEHNMNYYLHITQQTPDHILICGAEYARAAKAKVIEVLDLDSDGVYSISKQITPGAKVFREFGWATTDIAQIALCEYSLELFEHLMAEKQTAPFLFWCDTNLEEWQKKNNVLIGVDYDDD